MKKLLYLILLLPLWVNAQTNGTIQKTSATGTIRGSFGSLGLDTLLNVNAPTNGFVPVYNSTLKKSVWTNPTSFTPTISFGTFGSTPNAQGGSYSGGVIALQPADATNPGGVSTSAQGFTGLKTFNTASGSNALNINKTSADVGFIGFQVSAVDKSFIEWNVNDAGSGVGTAFNIRNGQGAVGLYDNTNTGLKISGGNGVFAGTVTGTTFNGSGSGLSGVVLTTTNQSIAGSKTFSDQIVATSGIQTGSTTALASSYSGTSSNDITLQNAGGQMIVGIDNSTGSVTGGVYNRFISLPTTRNFVIGNAGTNPLTLNGNTGALTITGSISSTPQGTLYGTATGSITSSQLATSLTDETGTGSAVFSASPTLTGTITMTNGTDGMAFLPYTGGSGYFGIYPQGVTPGANNFGYLTNTTTSVLGGGTGIIVNHSTGQTTVQNLGTGTVQVTAGVLSVISDGRLKNSKGKFEGALPAIMKLKTGNYYNWKPESKMPTDVKQFSLYADEVYDVLGEEFAPTQKDGNHSIQDRALLSLTIQALQEANAVITKQDLRILTLEKLFLELNERIKVLENK